MYKLAFGPKAFIVVSDPVVVRHLLKVRCVDQQDCEFSDSIQASRSSMPSGR